MLGVFYVFLEIVMALNIVQFWTFASEIFNTRQAKRLFPIVTGAANFGSMLAGASITVLVPWLGTPNLLYVIAVMLAANFLLVGILGRSQPASAATRAPARIDSLSQIEVSGPIRERKVHLVFYARRRSWGRWRSWSC